MTTPKTTNLGLNKVDRTSPETTTFNTKTLIDDNADLLDAKFGADASGHKHDGTAGNGPKLDSASLADGAVTDAVIGNRTISDTATPTGDTAKPATLFGWIANMVKQITGKANWRTPPAITLEAAKGHVDATSAHGSTSASTPGAIIQRDANGRAKVAAPSAADDIARKAEVDEVMNELSPVGKSGLNLMNGKQTISVKKPSILSNVRFRGRTLVNILGKGGNFETSSWLSNSANLELASDKFIYGSKSQKVITTATTGTAWSTNYIGKLDSTKNYIAICDVLNEDAETKAAVYVEIIGGQSKTGTHVPLGTTWGLSWVKISPNDLKNGTAINLHCFVQGTVKGRTAYFDGYRIYEISSAESAAIDSMNAEQIAVKYPYTEGIVNVDRVWIHRYGKDGATVEDHLYLTNMQAGASVDGSVFDEVYQDKDGRFRVNRQFGMMNLSGDLQWAMVFPVVNKDGYKVIPLELTNGQFTFGKAVLVDYFGRPLFHHVEPSSGTLPKESFFVNNSALRIAISNDDSGWSDSYTPSSDEIRAFFNGWTMWQKDSGDSRIPYTSGTKAWHGRSTGIEPVNVVPTTIEPESIYYQPYRLQYKLTATTDDSMNQEGTITLCAGSNLIELGTGIVVRERANPQVLDGRWFINDMLLPVSNLSFRLSHAIAAYRGRAIDKSWALSTFQHLHANGYYFMHSVYYDPTSVYTVTYLALDTYKLGIAPDIITAEHEPNLRGTVDTLVDVFPSVQTRLDALENEAASINQSQWITPTLLNGWMASTPPIQYRREGNKVRIRGRLKSGVVGQYVFKLPADLLPEAFTSTPAFQFNGNVWSPGVIDIGTNGAVVVSTINSATADVLFGEIVIDIKGA
ncbi:hypothetical protein [Gorillibacterium sp. CAU 1737]|uniref:hypothetical protein n=1 Tax=Gorillibacterium sp. CAU 1737 TaxID=3140362 RepID=UPI0032613CEE